MAIVQNPTASLADDVAVTKRTLAAQNGAVILVGHSYGGVAITEAGTDPKVAGVQNSGRRRTSRSQRSPSDPRRHARDAGDAFHPVSTFLPAFAF